MAYTYSIHGAGTSTNPIKVQIDQAACESKFVPVPYIIKGEETGCDGKTVFYNNIYYPSATELADLSCSCGTGTCNKWEEKWTSSDKHFTDSTYQQTIYYNVEVIKNCEKKPGCDTGCTVGDYWIKKADGKNITVSYEKYTFKDCDTVQRSIVTTTKTCGDGEITIDTGCGSFSFPYKCTTACTDAGSTKIVIRGATFTPVTVEYNGGKVKVSLSYEKIVKDKNCVEHKSRGSIILDATVPACTDKCCFDHPVDVKILKSDILKALGITDTTVKVIYKNKEVGTSLAIPIVQKANPGPECDKNCEYKTTYCVSGSNIKVEYETFWGSKDWTGTKVSPAGGRVRVLFDYLATAIAIDENGKPLTDKDGYQLNPDGTYKTKDGQKILETVCKPYTFNGNDSVIIEVSPCVAEESAEGSGNEKIQGEILYKERSSGCSKTCAEGGTLPCVDEYEYTDVVTNERYKMNLIKYEVIQDCSGICEPGTYKVYEEVPGNAGKCDTTFTGRAKYKTITVDNNCKVTTSEEAYEDMTVQISPNQTTNVVEIVNDYFRITQEAGPCLPPGGCNCDAVEIIGGNYPDVCTSPTYKYEDVHITCEPHEMVEVPFSGLCDGVVVVSGKYKWTGHFECNSGDSITHTREANGATMKVLQDGGCDCYEAEGGEHVVPGEDPGPGPGPGPGPDPKPNCVTPLDNVGQVCDDSTTATQEFIDEGFACDGGHWWNGPLDGENDEGFKAAGDTSGDSIRCKASNLVFEKVDNWIDYEIDTTTTGDFGKGVVRYTIAKNEGSKPRHGILKVKTKEDEHPDRVFDGHPTSDYFCTKWCNIHFYQKGNGETPQCERWNDWGEWQTATVDCRGGDSSATVKRTRTCATDPSIPPDEQTDTVHFTTTTCNTGGTITVYDEDGKKVVQEGGCDCSGGDIKLDKFLAKLCDGTGVSITKNGTPKAYSYIEEMYSIISGESVILLSNVCAPLYNCDKTDTAVKQDYMEAWAIAEVLSELYPTDNNKCKKFFKNAATNYGGVGTEDKIFENYGTYTSRVIGSMVYASVRGNDYENKLTMANDARQELGSSLRTGSIQFNMADLWDATEYCPSAPEPLSQSRGDLAPDCDKEFFDYSYQNYTNSNVTTNLRAKQAVEDEVYYPQYIMHIFNLHNNRYVDFLNNVEHAGHALSNSVRRNNPRIRPTTIHSSDIDSYLCDTGIRKPIYNNYGGYDFEHKTFEECCTCEKEWDVFKDSDTSYPSGHSGIVWGEALSIFVVLGSIDTNIARRAFIFGENRAVVRAHWYSDTIIARVAASSAIGMLNGCKKYIDLIRQLKS